MNPDLEHEQYSCALPFPHIVLDGMHCADALAAAAAEAKALSCGNPGDFYGTRSKRCVSDPNAMGEATRSLIDGLSSGVFLQWLERLTGMDGLHPDPDLFGGGLHQTDPGGFLKIHADFNWHHRLKMRRRINLLLYLNEEWHEEWGGHLELWPADMSARAQRIAPIFNRTVIFSTTSNSYHGHPEPLRCPKGVSRKSVALYYYSEEAASDTTARSNITNYRERPSERFRGLRFRAHRALVRAPVLQRGLGLGSS